MKGGLQPRESSNSKTIGKILKAEPFFWRVSKVDEPSIPLVWGAKEVNKIENGWFHHVWPNIKGIWNRNIIRREISDELVQFSHTCSNATPKDFQLINLITSKSVPIPQQSLHKTWTSLISRQEKEYLPMWEVGSQVLLIQQKKWLSRESFKWCKYHLEHPKQLIFNVQTHMVG